MTLGRTEWFVSNQAWVANGGVEETYGSREYGKTG